LRIGLRQRRRLPELWDRPWGNHGPHQGLSNGWLATLWLAVLRSEGGPRQSTGPAWAQRHRLTRQGFGGLPWRPVECHDDRLGMVRRRLADPQGWEAREAERWPATMEASRLEGTGVRLDRTTSYGAPASTPDGRMPLGHRNDHRPDRPQFQRMAAAVAGSGHWLGGEVRAGPRAADPLSLPLRARGRAILGQWGILSTGDSKRACRATRADMVRPLDYSLTILPRTGETRREIEAGIDVAVEGPPSVALLGEPPDRPGGRRGGCGTGRSGSAAGSWRGAASGWNGKNASR
jgi:hypothetical protein